MKNIACNTLLLILILSFNANAQTCTSSGGDDIDILDEPFHFRCGTAMMRDRYKKSNSDYKLIKTCTNYYADGNYYNKKGKIYFSSSYGEYELVVSADAKTFKCENGTARDKNNIYFMGKLVNNVDQKSFTSIGSVYCGDENNVYYRNKYAVEKELIKIVGANRASFKTIGEEHSYYAKDNQSVYYSGKVIENSDPATFELLEYGYAKDKNHAYYNGELIEGMKGNGFKVLKDCYLGSDNVQLCHGGKVLENSDAKTLTALACGYYKDVNNVYLNGFVLENLDSESFEILSWGYTKDKNAVYCDMKKIEGAEPLSFKVLGRKYSKDKSNIFYLNKKVSCDYKTFELDYNKDYLAKDKHGKISRGTRE